MKQRNQNWGEGRPEEAQGILSPLLGTPRPLAMPLFSVFSHKGV